MLLCDRCGAPVVTPATGGRFQCGYCHAIGEVRPRDDRPFLAMQLSPDHEAERIRRLWSQLQQGPSADPYSVQIVVADVAHLATTSAPDFPAAWLAAWNRAVSIVRQSSERVDQHRVYWLAQCLDMAFAPRNADPAFRRAVYETALEVVPDLGYRQIFRQEIGMRALRSDVDTAERWLAGCDPCPSYLTIDSDYRSVVARLRIVRRDWSAVLGQLGLHAQSVPIAPSYAPMCGLYRAHALADMGYEREAIERFDEVARGHPDSIAALLHAGEWFGLCSKMRSRVVTR